MASLTLRSVFEVFWSFLRGLADSLRGIVDVFFIDFHAAEKRKERLLRRHSRKEFLLNRDSPMREFGDDFAKKRALERREKEMRNKQKQNKDERDDEETKILSKTIQCCLMNLLVSFVSSTVFEGIVLPGIQHFFLSPFVYKVLGEDMAHDLWQWTYPILNLSFSVLCVVPFYILSKIVSALWFQEIADSAFKSSQGRQQTMSSLSVSIADTIFSIVIEIIFLLQGKLFSFLPIPSLGTFVSMFHMCLLHSLYCFEYKWFNQGLELHRRLSYIENHWPYFLGFGLPLSIMTSMTDSHVKSGCIFSVLFPFFIVSANQAHVVTVSSQNLVDISIRIFQPTIVMGNAIFSRTLSTSANRNRAVVKNEPQRRPHRQHHNRL